MPADKSGQRNKNKYIYSPWLCETIEGDLGELFPQRLR